MSKHVMIFVAVLIAIVAIGTASAEELPNVLNPVPLADGTYTLDGSDVLMRHNAPDEVWMKAAYGAPVIVFIGSTTDTTEIPSIEIIERPPDVNQNGVVDIHDLVKGVRSYGARGVYDIHFDSDLDGEISLDEVRNLLTEYST